MATVTELPQNIQINLDELENEDAKEPFRAVVKGRTIEMKDPAELDWQDLLEITNPLDFMRYCMEKEDRKFLHEQKIEGWRFGKLIEAYMTYYELDEKLEEFRRAQSRR